MPPKTLADYFAQMFGSDQTTDQMFSPLPTLARNSAPSGAGSAPTTTRQEDPNKALKMVLDFAKEVHNRHLGIGGDVVTPQNPTGDPRDPFNSGFFRPVNPAVAQASQGPSAVNQWTAMFSNTKNPNDQMNPKSGNPVDWTKLFAPSY